MSVSFKHPEYTANLDKWGMVSDCLGGAEKIKSQGTLYLPMPDPDNTTERNLKRYQVYKQRAVYINVVRRTLEGLRGAVFRQAPSIALPTNLEYLETNTDQKGLSLEQLSKKIVGRILDSGRFGLLVDFPAAPENRSRRDDQDAQYQAFIASYSKESIINWRSITVGGVKKTSLVVLEEQNEEIDPDGFGFTKKKRHRVLRLNDLGQYQQEIWVDGVIQNDETRIPLDSTGQPLNFIPFIFIGSENNDESIDYVPLYDLADISIAHYRDSADYQEMVHIVGQPTLFVNPGDIQPKDFKQVNDGRSLTLGVRDGYVLGQGGSAELLQATPSGIAKEAMEDKMESMIKIGARIITDANPNETATSAKIKHSSENSVLSNIVSNVTDALQTALRYCATFNGAEEEGIEFKLNKEFFEPNYDPQSVMADIQLYDRNFIGKKEIRDNLRKTGKIDPSITDQELDDRIDNEGV